MSKIVFSPYEPFIIRKPLFPIDIYVKMSEGVEISDNKLFNIFQDNLFREALYLASPSLFYRVEKWFLGEISDRKQIDKLRFSLLKYITRATSRATPFGLFAGCSAGRFSDKTKITTFFPERYESETSLDMVILDKVYSLLHKFPEIKRNILFFSNNSLYQSGKEYRYIKSGINKGKKEYFLAGTRYTSYLAELLKAAENGVLIEELIIKLIGHEVSEENASEFIDQLISEQILVSELQLSLTGENNLDILLSAAEKSIQSQHIFNGLKNIKSDLDVINRHTGYPITLYKKVFENLNSMEIDFKKEHAIQIDLYYCFKKATLGRDIQQKIESAFNITCKLIDPKKGTLYLKRFIADFIKRYNEDELPLTTVLDPEIGIGYGVIRSSEDSFMEGLELSSHKEKREISEWREKDDILLSEIYQCIRQNKHVLELPKLLITNKNESEILNQNDLPDTISALVEVVQIEGKEKIVFEGAGGSSAANLLARFANGNEDIKRHVQKIVDDEKRMAKDYILAEIIHIPQSRTGNILKRPSFRDFEIPYGGYSFLNTGNQIPIRDILISVKDETVMLRSKSLNKYILPRLTNAHNYAFDALPVYHFLCDLQYQNKQTSIAFGFHPMIDKFPFLPRIEYQDIILSKARWRILKESVRHLLDYNSLEFSGLVVDWVKELALPKFVQLREGDNKLLINTENVTCLKMLMDTIKNKQFFILEEFLQQEPGTIRNKKGGYCNEIVVSFYNQSKLNAL